MLRILVLAPWLPWPPHDGGRIRMLETLRFLGNRHDVTLLAHIHVDDERRHIEPLRAFCRAVEVARVRDGAAARLCRIASGLCVGRSVMESIHYSRAMSHRVDELLASGEFDAVHCEFSFVGHYLRRLRRGGVKRILSTHNVETQRLEREARIAARGFRKLAVLVDGALFPHWEARALRAFDGAAAVSESDRRWLDEHGAELETALVPNGVDTAYFGRRAAGQRSARVVFTGVMDYPPNVDAVIWFADEMLPRLRASRPELEFVVVGAKPVAAVRELARRPGVRVTGEVDDIRPFVAEAAAFVVPLRSGGGTRLKILQAMAMACPVVSTAMGAEGLAVEHRRNILIADTAQDFEARVIELVDSPELAESIGAAGRDLVLERYDWQSCLQGMEDLYRRVAGASRR